MPNSIITRPNRDHHGFYTVGEFKTYSKLEAIEVGVRIGKPVTWNYNRDVFENVRWDIEPSGGLDYYYRERAIQLREKYDYIVLFYSGGSDSHNVLMSFVKNNIFIDEIVQYHQLEAYNGDKTYVANLEQFATSIPITQQLIETNPTYKNTVHRLIDVSAFKKQVLNDKRIQEDWWHLHNDFMGVNATAVSNIKYIEPAYRQIADSGKTICFLWGVDKPHMNVDANNNWMCSFNDSRFATIISVNSKLVNETWCSEELFYWTPDFPEIAVKQAHVVKNYVENFTDNQVDNKYIVKDIISTNKYGHYVDMINTPSFTFTKNNQPYTMMLNGIRRLVYPWWQPELVVRPVLQSCIFADSDYAYLKSNAPDPAASRQYFKGVVRLREYMRKHAAQYWYEYKHDPKIGPFKGGIKPMTNTYSLKGKK